MATNKTNEENGKCPVKLRSKVLANGSKSLYLDCYVNGKRTYEVLKLYLVPEVGSRAEVSKLKAQNKNTLATAEAIKDKRYLEILSGKDGINKPRVSNMLLSDWMQREVERKRDELNAHGWHHTELTAMHLERYKPKATLADIDEAFCIGFVKYLQNTARSRVKTTYNPKTKKNEPAPLSVSSVFNYFNLFVAAINQAIEAKLMTHNPAKDMRKEDKPKRPKESKTYLELAELKRLVETPCRNEMVKRSFLFACLTGLRVSDVRQLTWGSLTPKENGGMTANIVMVKTGKPFTVEINASAVAWMPERGEAKDGDNIFVLPDLSVVEIHLSKWAQAAKVEKHVTFHVSRHTAATLLLSNGVDLFVTSKLLGHSSIEMTKTYAHLLDDAKSKAADKLNGLF